MVSLLRFLLLGALCATAQAQGGAAPLPALPPATASSLPRWRGFNLTEKFQVTSNKPFLEEDFRLISSLGFNFVRLPMDYRIWIKNQDWNQIDEAAFPEIDRAVGFGAKYHIHVCINFHRAPGYTVAKPKEAHDLWTDPEARTVCARHWAFFAKRYRGIANERLSFDLVNEPGHVDAGHYAAFVRQMVEAIRREDPERLIIADGREWGNEPCPELAGLGVAQATRGYLPMQISHYKAGWVAGTTEQPEPIWPMPKVSAILESPWKEPHRKPIVIEGPFPAAARLRLALRRMHFPADLSVKADGQSILLRQWEGKGEREVTEECLAQVPAGTKSVEISVPTRGHVILRELGLSSPGVNGGREVTLAPWVLWDEQSAPVRFDPADLHQPFKTAESFDRSWLVRQRIEPWKKLQAQGVGVFVGEWGAYNKTPHPVALAWMEDSLRNWREAGWGWALWNFRGSFGILDSGRADITYEEFQGHKLDRAMLNLLRKY